MWRELMCTKTGLERQELDWRTAGEYLSCHPKIVRDIVRKYSLMYFFEETVDKRYGDDVYQAFQKMVIGAKCWLPWPYKDMVFCWTAERLAYYIFEHVGHKGDDRWESDHFAAWNFLRSKDYLGRLLVKSRRFEPDNKLAFFQEHGTHIDGTICPDFMHALWLYGHAKHTTAYSVIAA